ncbi:homoserine O-acetyltransferase/O-succinyltransferase family protein [Vagococcus vulneris]
MQLLRLVSQTPLQINVDFIRTTKHEHKNSKIDYLESFYQTFDDIKARNYDLLIVTGAPVEKFAFEEVDYWRELQEILNWAEHHVTSSLFICWGAQAALYHYYNIQKTTYSEKLFGIYSQHNLRENWLLNGFDDVFMTPQSRYTGIEINRDHKDINILAANNDIGATILSSKDDRFIFILGHFEYDTTTLMSEYLRDLATGILTSFPKNYIDSNSTNKNPANTWRAHAHILFQNWINHVYQVTPYQLSDIEKLL